MAPAPLGQTLVVIDGTGLVQRRGRPVEAIRVGDAVRIEPGEWHWHGAAPGTAMTHLAIEELPEDGSAAELGDPVTEAEYRSGEHSAETPITRTVLLDQSLAAPQELHGVEIRRITIAPGCAAGLHVHNTPSSATSNAAQSYTKSKGRRLPRLAPAMCSTSRKTFA